MKENGMDADLVLYTIKGSCSDAVVALCAHLGLQVDVRDRQLHAKALALVNPDQCVPTLVTNDGLVLTETLAILNHLARLHAAELLGCGPVERARNEELLSYLASSAYSAFLLHFRPDRSADSEDARVAIRHKSLQAINQVLDTLNVRIAGKNFTISEMPTTSDFFLFVFCNWANRINAELLRGRAALSAHHARMQAMPFYSRTLDSHVA